MLNKTKQLTLSDIPEFKDLVEQHMLFINRFQQKIIADKYAKNQT